MRTREEIERVRKLFEDKIGECAVRGEDLGMLLASVTVNAMDWVLGDEQSNIARYLRDLSAHKTAREN